ncbi:hypothetical protein ALC56_10587 [Trachymyrmex septentrionalis]|uniref:Uncharacterized protein n=1 Tax=Trachymyrmex septentrionalis TaxID=34720 RepID=A0A195F3Z5_9HYME|nr:hypothetical protein ALC56_10587 [Trachymyrmex septentrionalis]
MRLQRNLRKSISPARKKYARKKTIRTSELIQRAQDLILEDPEISIRKLTAVLKENYLNVRHIVEEDLKYTSSNIPQIYGR